MRSRPRPTRTDDGLGLEQLLSSSSLFSGRNCRSAGTAGTVGAGSRNRYGCAATIAAGSPSLRSSDDNGAGAAAAAAAADGEFSMEDDEEDESSSSTVPRLALAAGAAAGGAG